MSDTFTSNNVNGIHIEPSGAATASANLANVQAENNTAVGIRGVAAGGSNRVTVTATDTAAAGNTVNGIVANATVAGGTTSFMLDRIQSVSNVAVGIRGDGAGATIRMANSEVTGNGVGSSMTNLAQFLSYGNNHIDGNTADGPNPGTIPEK